MRASRAALAALLLALSLAPAVPAPHATGRDTGFDTHYSVQGRVVNATGWPLNEVPVTASLLGFTAEDTTDCGGQFKIFVPTAVDLSEFDKVKVTAEGTTKELAVDPIARRTDLGLRVTESTKSTCSRARSTEVADWEYRYTIVGRVVERTADRDVESATLYGRPVAGERINANLSVEGPDRRDPSRLKVYAIPITGRGTIQTDARGDFTYHWILENETNGGFKITDGSFRGLNASIRDQVKDAAKNFEGRFSFVTFVVGTPPSTTPGPAVALLLAAGAAAALLGRRRA